MLMLGSMFYVLEVTCPSVSSPKKVTVIVITGPGGLGSRCVQGYLRLFRCDPWSTGNSGHARAVDTTNGMVWHGIETSL